MPRFQDYVDATLGAVGDMSDDMQAFFDGAQTQSKIPPGARYKQFTQLMRIFGDDTERLIVAVDAKFGEGQGQKYLAEMQRLEKKYRR